jgi:hypothetical protein
MGALTRVGAVALDGREGDGHGNVDGGWLMHGDGGATVAIGAYGIS